MKAAFLRALVFALTGLGVIAVWEVLTFELPREPVSDEWLNRLWLHVAVALGIAVSTFAGAIAGFRLVPRGRILSNKRVALFGAVFGLPAFSMLVFAVGVAGVVGAFIALVVVSALPAFVGGRLLSRHAA